MEIKYGVGRFFLVLHLFEPLIAVWKYETYKRYVPIHSFESQGDERWSAELDDKYRPTVMCCCEAITQRTVA